MDSDSRRQIFEGNATELLDFVLSGKLRLTEQSAYELRELAITAATDEMVGEIESS